MAGLDDLTAGGMADLVRRIEKLERSPQLGNTSVSRGSTIFNGNESLKVIGSQLVSGWLIVTGTLKVVGTFLLEGITTITGALTAKGVTRFEGDTTQQGPFHIVGATDLTGTMSVKPGGKVIVEGASAATLENGSLSFATGAKLTAYATGATLQGSSAGTNVSVENGSASLNFGTRRVSCQADGVLVTGPTLVAGDLTATGPITGSDLISTATATTTAAANTYWSSSGKLMKSTSAARFKIDAQEMDLPDSLLAVPVKDWVDSGSAERIASLYAAPRPFTRDDQWAWDDASLARVPGIIAEEVEAAGGEQFVTYGADGVIEGVAYDRLALARTEILARQVAELREQVAELKALLAA